MTLSDEERIKPRAEGNKLLHDTMKQLITISSGSILILIALLEKLFKSPQWGISSSCLRFVGFFDFAFIASLVMMRSISLKMGAAYDPAKAMRIDYNPDGSVSRYDICTK